MNSSSRGSPSVGPSTTTPQGPTPLEVLSSLTGFEYRVLQEMGENCGDPEEYAYGFRAIERWTGLSRAAVRTACRGLAAKGLLCFMRGLMTEDGEVAGSGYALTRAGFHLYWNMPARPAPSSAKQVAGESSREDQNQNPQLAGEIGWRGKR